MIAQVTHPHPSSRQVRPPKAQIDFPVRPRWLIPLCADAQNRNQQNVEQGGLQLAIEEFPRHRLIRARVPQAAAMDDAEFAAATFRAYREILAQFRTAPVRYGVRFWNFIPAINRPAAAGLNRYKVFNAGRFEAWRLEPGQADEVNGNGFLRRLPTASGVGTDGPDLVIDALAMDVMAIPVENPRQIPAYQYSRRYGACPPCFSRASLIRTYAGNIRRLLVGGTASVVGDVSMHDGNLSAQIDESLKNLAGLVRAADELRGVIGAKRPLHCFTDLRVYYPPASDPATIARRLRSYFAGAADIEYVPARLCREELLVEIEGVAELSRNGDAVGTEECYRDA